MIFTTNKPLAAGGASCTTPTSPKPSSTACSNAGRHLELRGRSYRTRHAPLDLTPASEPPSAGPARISGNHRPEFSEPTDISAGCPMTLDHATLHDPVLAHESADHRATACPRRYRGSPLLDVMRVS